MAVQQYVADDAAAVHVLRSISSPPSWITKRVGCVKNLPTNEIVSKCEHPQQRQGATKCFSQRDEAAAAAAAQA